MPQNICRCPVAAQNGTAEVAGTRAPQPVGHAAAAIAYLILSASLTSYPIPRHYRRLRLYLRPPTINNGPRPPGPGRDVKVGNRPKSLGSSATAPNADAVALPDRGKLLSLGVWSSA
jgi:hypothetical protein